MDAQARFFKKMRRLWGFTQPEMAKKIGVSFETYKSWEYGRRSCRKYYKQIRDCYTEIMYILGINPTGNDLWMDYISMICYEPDADTYPFEI